MRNNVLEAHKPDVLQQAHQPGDADFAIRIDSQSCRIFKRYQGSRQAPWQEGPRRHYHVHSLSVSSTILRKDDRSYWPLYPRRECCYHDGHANIKVDNLDSH